MWMGKQRGFSELGYWRMIKVHSEYTLRRLMEEHPEWADLPIVVYREEGGYDWVGSSGDVYDATTEEDGDVYEVLVFTNN